MTILPIFRPRARIKDRSPAAVGRASRVSGRRSAVSGAAADERDFFRREEDDDVTSGRSFSCLSVATVDGTLSSASTIVFGILWFDPLTATVVLITPMPFAGFAESGGLESAARSSGGKSVSTGPDFKKRTTSLSDSCCAFRPSDFESPLDNAG